MQHFGGNRTSGPHLTMKHAMAPIPVRKRVKEYRMRPAGPRQSAPAAPALPVSSKPAGPHMSLCHIWERNFHRALI